MMFLLIIAILAMTPASSQGVTPTEQPGLAPADSSFWGPLPARIDTVTAHFKDQPRPTWEKVALVPYYVVGLPFRVVDFAGRESVKTLDKWGLFGLPPAEHVGLPLPYGVYLLPDGSISGLEGISYGLNLRRPDFFGKGNMAYLTASSSTKHAGKLAGGFYFNLDENWGLQVGGGVADLPLTKYYGLGYASIAGDRSFYNRISRWVGVEFDRDLAHSLSIEMRSYFSRVQARESEFEVEQGLSIVHAGNLPYGFPGESSGVTFKFSLIRYAEAETGRPQDLGFQKAAVSWFTDTDQSNLSYLQYSLDVQHFFPLWFTQRTLGLRAFMTRIQNDHGSAIPLTRMATMYHPNSLRGFSDLRFYGLGNLGASAEYRWPLWVAKGRKGLGMDGYLFFDTGQVFEQNSEIAWNHMELTGGIGLRFIGSDGNFKGRFELGFSDEETIVTLTFSQNFQHHSKGLLYGKDPSRRP